MTDVSSVQTATALPDWAKPYVTSLLTSAGNIAAQPYQAYGGQRIAGYNPLQQQAITGIGGLGPSAYLGQGANLATQGATNQFTGANVGQYMSPYMQNVVNQQQAGAIRDYARQLPGMSAAASQAGGLGGTRQALVQAEGQRNLQNQLANIQATGSQQAFQNAQNQFNQQQQNLFQGAGLLGTLGQQQFGQGLQALQAQQQAGAGMQGLEQQRLDQMYQDYLAQRQYPQEQAKFMAGILSGGAPSTPGTSISTTTQPSPSGLSQVAGGLASLYGLYKLLG